MRSFVVCYPQRVRESSEQKTPCSLAPGCFGQIGRPGIQDSAFCTNAAHIFGELQLIKQMPLMVIFYFSAHLLSLPSRGAWIEIGRWVEEHKADIVAPLAGSVDRNAYARLPPRLALLSLPSRGAWIEIFLPTSRCIGSRVAPLAGSVDRNSRFWRRSQASLVAPLAGSVDRNALACKDVCLVLVAPLAGSVDRNVSAGFAALLSAVAPLAGSVDRNMYVQCASADLRLSLPSRGAWIEIPSGGRWCHRQ